MSSGLGQIGPSKTERQMRAVLCKSFDGIKALSFVSSRTGPAGG